MTYTPRYTNLVTLLDQSVRRFGHKPLFGTRSDGNWYWCTYKAFQDQVVQLSAGLASLGVQRGDRVAVISNNRLEWAVGAHACYRIGAAYTPMYDVQALDEWAFILNDSGAKVCFAATAAIRDSVQTRRDQLATLEHVICFDDSSYPELLAKGRQHPVDPQLPPDDTMAALIYTSGTTGRPKGVMLTHRNLASNASACLEAAPFKGEERSLAFLPWAHVFGGALELNALMAYGASIAICGDSKNLLEYLPEVQPTLLFAVPRVWNRVYAAVHSQIEGQPKPVQLLFKHGLQATTKARRGERLSLREQAVARLADKLVFSKVINRFGGRLRFAFSGAAALSPEVARFIDCLGVAVYEGYGLTETCAGTTANIERRFGSVGKPMPGISIRIDESVESMDPGEGEIIVYGDGVMSGYYNLEDETRQQMTADGGLRTGDLGRLDADGYLYITGRVKELFKLENGKYVAPAPLEEQLQLSPYISQCVVYGADRPHLVALIIPDMDALRTWAEGLGLPHRDDDRLLNQPETRALFLDQLQNQSARFKGYERIRNFILRSEELSINNGMLTPSLKVKRRIVLARYGEQLDDLYKAPVEQMPASQATA